MRVYGKKTRRLLEEDGLEQDFNLSKEDDENINLYYRQSQSKDSQYLEYLKFLMGAEMTLWMIHWQAKPNSRHVRIDEFRNEIDEYVDIIAEVIQGNTEQFSDIAGKTYKLALAGTDDENELIRMIERKVIDFDEEIKDDPEWKGACNANGNFLEAISKYKYLFSLCGKED